jgi:predicted  nucleic acid-binding Zn-ribbon protein
MSSLPVSLRGRYERVHTAKKGQAVADLTGDSCAACGARLPPQTAIQVRRGTAIVECPDCGRILLHKANAESGA